MKKGHRRDDDALTVCAGDPAPQQLTAPCRKYSGRLHTMREGKRCTARIVDVSGLLADPRISGVTEVSMQLQF
jgi:hypothetical protein